MEDWNNDIKEVYDEFVTDPLKEGLPVGFFEKLFDCLSLELCYINDKTLFNAYKVVISEHVVHYRADEFIEACDKIWGKHQGDNNAH